MIVIVMGPTESRLPVSYKIQYRALRRDGVVIGGHFLKFRIVQNVLYGIWFRTVSESGRTGVGTRRAGLDQVDRKILNCLQRNSRITNKELSERAGTSAPSCLRRVRRLRAEGYIEREIALVNPDKAGTHLVAISEVRLSGHNPQARDRAIQIIREIPEVILCYNVTGDRDLLFIAVLADMADFEETITEPLASVPEIHSINSYFAIKRIKFSPMWHFDESP